MNKGFSVELAKKDYISEIVLSNDPRNTVLVSGDLGQVLNITLVEEMILELRYTHGNIRLDIDADDLFTFISKLQETPQEDEKNE